ncbi:MAG: class I SAM-dependent methyltransferase [Planctomycetota bacterium]
MADPLPGEALDSYYESDRRHGEEAYQDHDKNLRSFGAILERIERYVPPGRLLDIGCSIGTSLVAARVRGWRPTGIEPSRPVAEFGRKEWGLDIRCARLEDAGLADGSFPAVLMHHTLEHLRDPGTAIESAYRLLQAGGVMYQALPNFDSLKSRLFGPHWGYGVHSDHLSFFGPRTLSLLLRRHGFEILELCTKSHKNDPRLLHDVMSKLGRIDLLMRWCGKPGGDFDPDSYLRFLAEHRWANWICNRMWPSRLVSLAGLGEELHVLARRN